MCRWWSPLGDVKRPYVATPRGFDDGPSKDLSRHEANAFRQVRALSAGPGPLRQCLGDERGGDPLEPASTARFRMPGEVTVDLCR